ncbi:MAG: ABC transporter ATP-binding protein [Erysipelotrichaceae bacterium]|nr:ABC transporter ATP-binding protein [Erysipelotrichaceae bacterium]
MKVTIKDLTKKFASRDKTGEMVTAVDTLSAEFESGKLIALLGPSGCGKSTMLNMLSGILPVTSGKIYFDDVDVTDLSPDKREVGLVFQNYALYPHMTVLENICFPLKIKKVPKAERIEKAVEIAKMVHIEDYLKRLPKELSGGQQQRVAIARALVKKPKLLLLDEPLSNLDAKLRVEMREEIRRIQRECGVTTVFVTHDQEEATSISDYILLMKLGVMQQFSATREIYNNPGNLFVADFIANPTINQIHGTYTADGIKADGCDELIPCAIKANEGDRVVFAVRPEAVIFENEKNTVNATVNDLYSSGKDWLVNFMIGDTDLRGYCDADFNVSEGSKIKVGFKEKGAFLFNEATGERY